MINSGEKILKQNGHSLESIGVSGFGLDKHFALELIKILRAENIAILGGDVYRINANQIEPTYDNWFLDKADGMDDSIYIEKSLEKAGMFIQNYNDPENGTILYKLEIRGC